MTIGDKLLGRKSVKMQPKKADEPEWVSSMHSYYQKTGLYRTHDLDRVLGDPRQQVSGTVSTEFDLASRLLKK